MCSVTIIWEFAAAMLGLWLSHPDYVFKVSKSNSGIQSANSIKFQTMGSLHSCHKSLALAHKNTVNLLWCFNFTFFSFSRDIFLNLAIIISGSQLTIWWCPTGWNSSSMKMRLRVDTMIMTLLTSSRPRICSENYTTIILHCHDSSLHTQTTLSIQYSVFSASSCEVNFRFPIAVCEEWKIEA